MESRMSTVCWVFGVVLLSYVDGQRWGWGNFALENSCGWKYGGKCKLSCASGEYIIGLKPCGYGMYGLCCAPTLKCEEYGGTCKQECNRAFETEFTYKVRCASVSQSCCLRKAVEPRVITTAPTTMAPAGRRCSARPTRRITSRILGGSVVDSVCQWPWMVSIRMGSPNNPGSHICAGVLVSSNKVITTVNCVRGQNVFVTLKERNINIHGEFGEIDISISRSPQIHPNFTTPFGQSSLYDNDVAILTLDSHVPSTSCVEPVCLPLSMDAPTRDSRCYIAGWGGNGIGDGKLHEARVEILNNALCKAVIQRAVQAKLPDDKLCSLSVLDRVDACPGDNGGMLVCEDSQGVWSLFGVISDNACSQQRLPVIYTDLQRHMDWINQNV